MMFLVAKLPFPRGSGSHSLKQWAAGAPVIGAAPVSSGRPKRPRSEGLSGSGALQLKVLSQSSVVAATWERDLQGRAPNERNNERNEKKTCQTLHDFYRTLGRTV